MTGIGMPSSQSRMGIERILVLRRLESAPETFRRQAQAVHACSAPEIFSISLAPRNGFSRMLDGATSPSAVRSA